MYASIVEMVGSNALRMRIAACAADEGVPDDPVTWVNNHMWAICSDGAWVAAWDSARATSSENYNPDTGARDDVITDGMILAVVQPMIGGGAVVEA